MRSLNLTILLCVCYLATIAQQYVPMPTGATYWRYRSTFADQAYMWVDYDYFLLVQTGDDTTINGLTYKKIMRRSSDTSISISSTYVPPPPAVAEHPDVFFAGLRESNQKVFIYSSWGIPTLWHEELLYDFTASVGDTVPHVNFYKWQDSTLLVTAIDSVQIGSSFRKRYHVQRINTPSDDTMSIIEGIGTSRGLLGFMPAPVPGGNNLYYKFYCMNDGTTVFNPEGLDCSYMWPSTTPVSVHGVNTKPNVLVYPVPFSNTLTIDANGAARASLYNMLGVEVLRHPLNGKTELQTDHLQPGIYFLKLVDTSGAPIHTQKLVKE